MGGMLQLRSRILEVVLEREPGSGSIHFSAYAHGCIAPTARTRRARVHALIDVCRINDIYGEYTCIYLAGARTTILARSAGEILYKKNRTLQYWPVRHARGARSTYGMATCTRAPTRAAIDN